MKRVFLFLFAIFVACPAFAANKIVATYPPIQSLVWSVTEGVAPVNVMFSKAQANHHNVQLKPSQMRILKGATIVFYASDDLETFMKDALKTVAPKAKAYSLMDEIPDLTLLESKKDKDKKDVHYWLDVDNALLMVDKITEIMINEDPKNEKKYLANQEKSKSYINSLKTFERPDEAKKFVAFHDGFEYMANSFDLDITTSDIDLESMNTPKAVKDAKKEIKESKAVCFLVDPQTNRRYLKSLDLKDKDLAKIDAFGWNIDTGVGQYYRMMRWNLERLVKCSAKK
ncbi:MAG: zinc ABC transporter substrate-binding protein [Alphaproteobacteria bacterium]|nr:zinc ABC transporter substrate-binding protein [Alphaproteobacteria bacterium]